MSDRGLLSVTVVCAWPDRTWSRPVVVPAGGSVADALAQVALDASWQASTDLSRIGVFGKIVSQDHVLADGDRIEIYRPLLADPKASRRKRAARGG